MIHPGCDACGCETANDSFTLQCVAPKLYDEVTSMEMSFVYTNYMYSSVMWADFQPLAFHLFSYIAWLYNLARFIQLPKCMTIQCMPELLPLHITQDCRILLLCQLCTCVILWWILVAISYNKLNWQLTTSLCLVYLKYMHIITTVLLCLDS